MTVIDSLATTKRPLITVEAIVVFAGCLLGSFVLSLFAWVMVPSLLFGWEPLAITSGSMAPAIQTGDVVLVDPDFQSPGRGSVIAFDSGNSTVVHRVTEALPNGSLVTRGDANPNNDSSPVTPDHIRGTGRLLVPFIGVLGIVGWAPLLLAGGVVAAIVWWWPRRPVLALSVLAASVGLAFIALAAASFVAATGNTENSVTAIDVAPPASLAATCGLIGGGNIDVSLSWSGSPTPGLTAYHVYHDPPGGGTNYTQVGTIPADATSFVHEVPASLLSVGTHTYTVRGVIGPWESENSNTDAVSITQVLGVFLCS